MEERIPRSANHAFDLQHLCRYFSERSSQAMIAVEGPNHIVRHVNAAFERLAGVDRATLIGRPFFDAVPEGTSNGCAALCDRVFKSGIPEVLAEQRHQVSPPAYWSYSVWAILGAYERPVGVMIQVSEATEIRLFREQTAELNEALLNSSLRQHELIENTKEINTRLEAALKEKEYFIAVLSHELRTPLTPVLLAASMLQNDSRLESDTRDIMQMIHENITLEARLIDDLLDMTRMENGKLHLERHPIDLRRVVESAVETCRSDIDATDLSLSVHCGDVPMVVFGDEGRLRQVVGNLLRNAVKFTQAKGHVRIKCACGDDFYELEVSDTGQGIDPDFLPRVFLAFEQGNKTETRKPGLGLGLAICKTIVNLHGGSITAHSDGKHRGATFIVRLPVLVGVKLPNPEIAPVDMDPFIPAHPLEILLVEDHADTARVIKWLLTKDGHSVQWAGDISTGLKLARAHRFDLLLSDLGLPDGSGIDLMHRLRKEGSPLIGIIISGYGQDEDVSRSIDAGFAAHLVKPLSRQKLRDAINALRI